MASSLDRAMAILESLAERPRTVPELTELFEAHRTTILRQMRSLEESGFVLARSDSTYTVGPRLVTIATEALNRYSLRDAGHELIKGLQAEIGHAVHLAQRIGDQIIYVDKAENSTGLKMRSRIGMTAFPQCSALGKAVLSQLSPRQRDRVLAGLEWTRYTDTTITTREQLDAELAVDLQRGHSLDNGEYEDFLNCVAVPITNSTKTLFGALSVTSIKMQADLDELALLVPRLRETADKISSQLI